MLIGTCILWIDKHQEIDLLVFFFLIFIFFMYLFFLIAFTMKVWGTQQSEAPN